MGLRSFCTYICSEKTPLQRLAFAATICLRIIYVLFVLTAGWAYPGVHNLLGKITGRLSSPLLRHGSPSGHTPNVT